MAKPTIRDVAALAGVSAKSVSFAVNGLGGIAPATARRIEAAVAALGYVPSGRARALATGRSGLIALFLCSGDAGEAALLQGGALAALTELDKALLVLALEPDDGASARRFIEAHAPEGVILAPALSSDGGANAPAVRAALLACGTAHVRLAHCLPGDAPGDDARTVWCDDRQGSSDAMAYLLALGHRRVGFIAGPDACPAMAMREMGVLDALAAHGLDRGAELFAQGDGSAASGEAAARLLLEVSPRPSAILAADEAMAAGALRAARAAGLAVPGDLSVMALGPGTLAPLLDPPLSHMRLDLAAMAQRAVRLLIDQASAQPGPPLLPRLIVGGSTGPAPA